MSRVTPTVEGGLLTAITVMLGLAAVYLPVFGAFVEFFCGVPIVVLTVRQGVRRGAIALAASFILLTMFVGPLLSLRIALSFGLCGLVLGICMVRGFGTVQSFLTTLVAAFVAQVIAVGILMLALGVNPSEVELKAVQEAFDESFKMYEEMGVDQQAIAQLREQVAPSIELLKYLMPMILLIMAVINAAACYLTAKWIFHKLHMKFLEPLPPFHEWRFPIAFLYLAAFAILGVYWGSTRGWEILYTVSVNLAFLAMSVGFLQGLAVLSCVAEHYNVSTWLRRVIFVIIILNMLTIQIVAFTGMFDMIFDYRKKFSDEGR